jgi:hypothetical protein
MTAEIIHDDDVAGAEGGQQELLDIGAKAGALIGPSMTQGAVMRSWRSAARKVRVPAAVRHLGGTSRVPRRQRPCRRVMLALGQSLPRRRGLVDEHRALGVKPALVHLRAGAPTRDVGAVLLAGVQAFFVCRG